MRRCFELALKAKGNVSPNPLVGAVIVHNNKIIGEGYHQEYGSHHAEVNAINAVKDKSLLSKSTLYVNLEPCSHHGKTPPCSDLIIKNKIPEVVICNEDPNPLVNGKGIQRLKNSGVLVQTGILKEEGEYLNRYFFNIFKKKRPYIILKWAETADGFIGLNSKSNTKNKQISGPQSKKWLHKLRTEVDTILVGVNTVNADNPQLNGRLYPGKDPVRIVLDPNNRIDLSSQLITDQKTTYIISNEDVVLKNAIKIKGNKESIFETLLNLCSENKWNSILVEGGSKTLDAFIKNNFWDEAFVLSNKMKWGDGIKAPKFDFKAEYSKNFGDQTSLTYYRNNL